MSFNATLKLQCTGPDVNEDWVTDAIQHEINVEVKQVQILKDSTILVLISAASEQALETIYNQFPIADNKIQLIQTWGHYPETPPIVMLRNPPQGVTKDRLEVYLEDTQGIDVLEITEEDNVFTIELADSTDLPYLVTKTHTLRRQQFTFEEASTPDVKPANGQSPTHLHVPVPDMEESWQTQVCDQEAPTPIFSYRRSPTPPPLSSVVPPVVPPRRTTSTKRVYENKIPIESPKALKITQLQLGDDFAEKCLREQLQKHPYFLTIDRIDVTDGTAYVTFTPVEGINKFLDKPLTHLVGSAVETSIVPLESVPVFQNYPKVLLIQDLPDGMAEAKVKKRLERLFKGHVMEKCIVKEREAYITFKDPSSVHVLINDPPDNGMLLGRPVVYSTANEEDMFDDDQPLMLVVEDLPDLDDDDADDVTDYLQSLSQCQIVSCEIKNRTAYVHYNNPEDVRKVVKDQPSVPLYGKQMKFRAEPVHRRGTLLHTVSESDKLCDSPANESPQNGKRPQSSPAVVPRIKPRTVVMFDKIAVRQLPPDINVGFLKMYLDSLSGAKCVKVEMNEGVAIVKLDAKIDIKSLQEKIASTSFANASLVIEAYKAPDSPKAATPSVKPRSGLLCDIVVVKGIPFGVQEPFLKMYLDLLSGVKCVDVEMNGETAIVKLSSKVDIKSLRQKAHSQPYPEGDVILEIESFDPSDPTAADDLPDSIDPAATRQHSDPSDSILVKEIPSQVTDGYLSIYLTNLTGAQCTGIQRNEGMAVVKLNNKLDIKSVRQKALKTPFPEGNVVLAIESIKPSTDVLISSESTLPRHVVEMFCEQFGEVLSIDKLGNDYTATFKTLESHDKCLEHPKHIAGTHQVTVTDYNPLLATKPSSVPPPLPPRKAVYSWPSHRVPISPESVDYYLNVKKSMNEELIQIHGELHVNQKILEVKPLTDATEIDDWDNQVKAIVEKYKQEFEQAELKMQPQTPPAVLNYLAELRGLHPDLYYLPAEGLLKLAGHADTVRKATKEIRKLIEEEIEITYNLEKPPRFIKYLLKFAQNEINAVQPPVRIDYQEDKPGSVTIRGVNRSLEAVKNISERWIREAHTEIIRLTPTAYRLLTTRRGKGKVAEQLNNTADTVMHIYERIDQHPYEHQLCILSPISASCAIAKRNVASLIEEKRISFSPDESHVFNGQEWRELVEKTVLEYFISVSVSDGVLLLTGEEKNLAVVAEQMAIFLRAQNSITDEIFIQGAVWQLVNDQAKLKAVQKDAKKMNVKLTYPGKGVDNDQVAIGLSGEVKSVERVKTQLKMLFNEVQERTIQMAPQVGLDKLVEKGLVAMRCNELEHKHKVVIKHHVEEVTPPKLQGKSPLAPRCVIRSTCPSGAVKVDVYTGDPAQRRADVLAMFVSEIPIVDDHPLMASLATSGGAEVKMEMDALLMRARPRLIPATIHRTQNVGNLPFNEICHIVLPHYGNKSADATASVESAICELLERVSMNSPNVVITPLTSPPHSYPVEFYAHSMLTVLSSANLGIYGDVSAAIFLDKELDKEVFLTKMREMNYIIHKSQQTQRVAGGDGSGLKVQLICGDVTKTRSDVIVNSTSIDMRHDSNAICKAIHSAGGVDLKKACQNLVDQGVLLKDGLVVPTVASGSLRFNRVYHAHMPGKLKGRPPTREQSDLLKLIVTHCLQQGEEESQKSLAMPAFCLGIGHYTVPESAKPTLDAIREFAQSRPAHLKEVSIVILDKKMYSQFAEFFTNYFSDVQVTPFKTDTPKGADGICVTLALPSASISTRGRLETVIQEAKKCKVIFQVYGLQNEALTIVEKEIRMYLSELIIDDMVDLGDMSDLINDSDIENVHKLARQEGVEVNIQRRMNRVLITGEERAVEKVCIQVQRKIMELNRFLQELHMFDWIAVHPDGLTELYKQKAARQLEMAFKRNQQIVNLKIDDVWCTVDVRKMEERVVKGGVTRKVLRSRKTEVEYPGNWNLTAIGKDVVTFEDVPENTQEYTTATQCFNATIGHQCTIAKVERVQNPSEYTRYQSLKNTLIMLHGRGNVAEKELFHGTKKENIKPICSTGFNRGYAAESNAARFGKGVYFALNASYSMQDKYSTADNDGYKYILVCSLLVCRTIKGNEKIKVPPPLPDRPEVLYDTLVDNEQNPTIFVAMKDSQAYPKYLIMFKK